MSESMGKVLAISGGVGGAKLALGLARVVPAELLTVAANTADDFQHLGLYISPDLDTVMYTLAGINNQQQGWGLAGESWQVMQALETVGGDSWFRLGDRDLATHLVRTQRLQQGDTLSQVTDYLCRQLNVEQCVLPMSDQPVRTIIRTHSGELAFQEYFVREQCRPEITGYYFAGVEQAQPQPQMMTLLADRNLRAIIICPSNPFVSVAPMLALQGVREALAAAKVPVIAVSPIVAGTAIKGPAAKMMAELNMPVSAVAIAEYYGELIDGFVIDRSDAQYQKAVQDRGLACLCVNTVMKTLDDRIDLARAVLSFADQIHKG